MEVGALTRQNSRRRSFSQLSVEIPRKEITNIEQSGDEEEFVKVAKPLERKVKKPAIDPDNRGYQSEIIYLQAMDMIIQRMEELQWEKITQDLDFSEDPGPISLNFNFPSIDYERALQAEEGILSTSTSIDESCCSDKPCSSRNYSTRPAPLDPETDAEAYKTDYEEVEIPTTSEFVDQLLREVRERTKKINNAEDLVSIVSLNDFSENTIKIPVRPPPSGSEVFVVDNKRVKTAPSWKPPKRKFIYDLPEVRDTQTMLTLQNEQCAGCGMKFTKLYARRARHCYYYNKLFCQCCFSGERARIPAKILHQWNFKEYPVSDCAFKFLNEYADHPVYSVRAVNPDLYRKIKNLKKIQTLRIKASHMWQYIRLCRAAETTITPHGILKTAFTSIPSRFLCLEEVDVYSVLDFEAIESGNLVEMLEPIVACGKLHIEGCPECEQRSFFCSICFNVNDHLFSFQLERVYQCDECGTLSHQKCFNKQRKRGEWKCSRCERIRRKHIRHSSSSSTFSIECNSD